MCDDALPNASSLAISLSVLMSASDVNQRLHSLQTIVIVPDSPSGVRTRPNAREETLVVLTSGVTAINRVSHDEDIGLLESRTSQKKNNDQLL